MANTERTRVIYQSEALFVAGTGTAPQVQDQLLRVQDITHGVELNRQDINEFGQLAAIERKIIEPPTVSLDFSYYVHGGRNEELLGVHAMTGASRGVASTAALENNQALKDWILADAGKDYYICVADEGDDAKVTDFTAGGQDLGVIGIGNGYVTSFSVEASVGDIPSSSVSVEASNLRFSPSGVDIPCANVNLESGIENPGDITFNMPTPSRTGTTGADGYSVTCLRPGDISVNFNDGGNSKPSDAADSLKQVQIGGAILEGAGKVHIQNFTLDFPVARTPLNRIGNVFPYSRDIDLPMNVTLSVSALMADMDEGSVASLLCANDTERNIRISMDEPCGTDDEEGVVEMEWLLKGCTLDSQNFSASIGENKTVDLVFNCQLGGVNSKDKGVWFWSNKNDSLGSAPAFAVTQSDLAEVNPHDDEEA